MNIKKILITLLMFVDMCSHDVELTTFSGTPILYLINLNVLFFVSKNKAGECCTNIT